MTVLRRILGLLVAFGACGMSSPPAAVAAEPRPGPVWSDPDEAEGIEGVEPSGPRALELRLKGTVDPKGRTAAIASAVAWFAAHQHPEGSWRAAELDWCDGSKGTGGEVNASAAGKAIYDVGVTSLVLLALLAAGHDPGNGGPHAKAMDRALTWLVARQDAEGCVGTRDIEHFVYNHGFAARALVEAFGATGDPRWLGPAQRALGFIGAARNPYFGWRYGVRPGDNDTSVTCLNALTILAAWRINQAAADAGRREPFVLTELIGPPDEDHAIAGALTWLGKMTDPDYGRLGYTQRGQGPSRAQGDEARYPGEKSESMTAAALCVRLSLPEAYRPAEAKWIELGTGLLLEHPPNGADGPGIDHYYWSYGSHATALVGGKAFQTWDEAVVKALLPAQKKEGRACGEAGSWDPVDPWGREGGRMYSTAMAVLSLAGRGRPSPLDQVAMAMSRDLGAKDASPAALVRALRTIAVAAPPAAEAAVVPHLSHADPAVRRAAAAALLRIAPPEAGWAAIVKQFQDPDAGVRRSALLAATGLPDDRRAQVGEAASPALADLDAAVRSAAAALLAQVPGSQGRADEVFVGVLGSPDPVARAVALRDLQRVPSASSGLITAVRAALEGSDVRSRTRAASSLLRWGASDDQVRAALLAAWASDDDGACSIALHGLEGVSPPPSDLLAPAVGAALRWGPSLRLSAIHVLAKSDPARAPAYLHLLREDFDVGTARAARDALAALEQDPATQAAALGVSLVGPDPRAAEGARRGLAALGRASVDTLRAALTATAQGSPERIRVLRAAAGLGAAGKSLEPALFAVLGAPGAVADEVLAAAAALAQVGTTNAKVSVPLLALVDGPDPKSAERAIRILGDLVVEIPALQADLVTRAANKGLAMKIREVALRQIGSVTRPTPATLSALWDFSNTPGLILVAWDVYRDLGKLAAPSLAPHLSGPRDEALHALRLALTLGPGAKGLKAKVTRLTQNLDREISEAAWLVLGSIGRD